MPGWAARALDDLPFAADAEAGAPWYPLQHAFGVTAFGANVFVAGKPGHVLVEPHDESGSGQEELYLVLRGSAEFTLDGANVTGAALFVVAVREPQSCGARLRSKPKRLCSCSVVDRTTGSSRHGCPRTSRASRGSSDLAAQWTSAATAAAAASGSNSNGPGPPAKATRASAPTT